MVNSYTKFKDAAVKNSLARFEQEKIIPAAEAVGDLKKKLHDAEEKLKKTKQLWSTYRDQVVVPATKNFFGSVAINNKQLNDPMINSKLQTQNMDSFFTHTSFNDLNFDEMEVSKLINREMALFKSINLSTINNTIDCEVQKKSQSKGIKRNYIPSTKSAVSLAKKPKTK